MTRGERVSIVNVGYRSTNYWVVSAGKSRILVDLGWPGLIGPLLANLKRKDIPLSEIRYGLATHYHIDHAGAAQDLKDRGMRLVVTPEQQDFIPAMKRWTKPVDHYTNILTTDNLVIPTVQSRAFLYTLGICGEIVHTPGHSNDSVTLVLDNGVALTGDLTLPALVSLEDPQLVNRSWQTLRDMGVTMVYAGHGSPRTLDSVFLAGVGQA